MGNWDFLDAVIGTVGKELSLEGTAELTKINIKQNEENGQFSLYFLLDNNYVFVNLASKDDSDAKKKACAISVFNTLYNVSNSPNNMAFKDALAVASEMCPCVVKYKFKESYSEKSMKSYKNLVKLEFVEKIELAF